MFISRVLPNMNPLWKNIINMLGYIVKRCKKLVNNLSTTILWEEIWIVIDRFGTIFLFHVEAYYNLCNVPFYSVIMNVWLKNIATIDIKWQHIGFKYLYRHVMVLGGFCSVTAIIGGHLSTNTSHFKNHWPQFQR